MNLRQKIAAAAIVVGLSVAAAAALAQNSTTNIIATLLGNEVIEVLSQTNGTAAISWTTTANLRDGRDYIYQVPTTGFTITMAVSKSAVSLNPAGTLATGTIVMPPTVYDGKIVTVFTTQTITALTLSTSNSATFAPAAPTTLTAGAHIAFVYDLANNAWHRFQ